MFWLVQFSSTYVNGESIELVCLCFYSLVHLASRSWSCLKPKSKFVKWIALNFKYWKAEDFKVCLKFSGAPHFHLHEISIIQLWQRRFYKKLNLRFKSKIFYDPGAWAEGSSELLVVVLVVVVVNVLHVFSRTTGPISNKIDTRYPWMKLVQRNCSTNH